MYNTVHYPPTPGGGFGGATERGGQPQQGAVAGVKMVRPVWSLSLSMLTDLWWSPKSSMKNFGSVRQRHRTRCAQGWLCATMTDIHKRSALELHQDLWRLPWSCTRIAGGSSEALEPLSGMWDGPALVASWKIASGGSETPGSWPGRIEGTL